MSLISIGTEWEGTITKCPICKHEDGFEILDSMGTARCAFCGSRYIPTMGGVMYVGEWKDYACKDMFMPPFQERRAKVKNA